MALFDWLTTELVTELGTTCWNDSSATTYSSPARHEASTDDRTKSKAIMATIVAAPVTALLRAPVTSRSACRVQRAPLGGVTALPRSSAVSFTARRSTTVRCVNVLRSLFMGGGIPYPLRQDKRGRCSSLGRRARERAHLSGGRFLLSYPMSVYGAQFWIGLLLFLVS